MTDNLPSVNDLLKTLHTTDSTSALHIDNAGVYHITGSDELIDKINQVLETISNQDFTEGDRPLVRETRKFATQFIKTVDRAVIDERARVFDPINDERKAINDRMNQLKMVLNTKLDEFDQRIREEKRASLIAHFNDEMLMSGFNHTMPELTFESVENQSWFNRSASLPKARKELTERLHAITSVIAASNKSISSSGAVDLLIEQDWNVATVLAHLAQQQEEERQRKQEEEAIARQRAEELAEAERRGREQAEREARERGETTASQRVTDSYNQHREAEQGATTSTKTARAFTLNVEGTQQDVATIAAVMRNTLGIIDGLIADGELTESCTVTLQ